MFSKAKIAAIAFALCAPATAFAQAAPAAGPSIPTQVKTAATYYVASLTCTPPQDVVIPDSFVVHLRQTKTTTNSEGKYIIGDDVWAVLFTNMMSDHPTTSCGGGNGNPGTLIAIVQEDDMGEGYYVDPAQSYPSIKFDEPIAQVVGVTSIIPNTLTLTGNNYGPHDSQAQATVSATVTMTVDVAGNWSVVKPLSQ
jgi:hypothetical protein